MRYLNFNKVQFHYSHCWRVLTDPGVEMGVYNTQEGRVIKETCYVEVLVNACDTMGRIKMVGGAGLASAKNFCLYCKSPLCSLAMRAGYIRHSKSQYCVACLTHSLLKDFPMRDSDEQLHNKFLWREQDDKDHQERIFERTGVKFVILDLMPGWHASFQSPIDAMHNFFLGITCWIVKRILSASGLLSTSYRGQTPMDKWDECLKSAWFPNCYGRLPPRVSSDLYCYEFHFP
jgi:hypothetical protein